MLGAIGYLISPFDSLPDLTPFVGYTDDLGVLSFALVTVACYINDDVRDKARAHVENYYLPLMLLFFQWWMNGYKDIS